MAETLWRPPPPPTLQYERHIKELQLDSRAATAHDGWRNTAKLTQLPAKWRTEALSL